MVCEASTIRAGSILQVLDTQLAELKYPISPKDVINSNTSNFLSVRGTKNKQRNKYDDS